MPFRSPFPDLEIPSVDILTYIFPPLKPEVAKRPIWIDANDSSSYLSRGSMLAAIKRFAYGLQRKGIQAGDVVMLLTPNHIYVPLAFLSIVGVEAIFTGANPSYTVDEIANQLADSQAKLLLVHPTLLETSLQAAAKAGLPRDSLWLFDDAQTDPVQGVPAWQSMIGSETESQSWKWQRLDGETAKCRVATINYSSGTTGLPKGVCISHANLIANVEQHIFIRDHMKQSVTQATERWIGFLPLYHAYGQLYSFLMAPKLGVPVYIMKEFHFESFLRVIETYKITHLQAIPPILVMLNKRPETTNYDLSSLTNIICGAAPLSQTLQNEVMDRFNLQINQGWGMTEVTCGGMNMPGGIRDTTGSIGILHPNCECKIVDEKGTEVGQGKPGELYIRGPNVCLGYWRNQAATKEALSSDGWLKTGDVVKMNDQQWFWIIDRKKELIKVNGLQVAPAEIEAALLQHEAIADAAVVGIVVNGEEKPRAYVVLRPSAIGRCTLTKVHSWIQSRLARHKWLEGGIKFVDDVPRLTSGKIKRRVLKEWAQRDAWRLEAGPQSEKAIAKL
ncbi:hypothetical protein N7451_003095 [Penicillium sp. IBT 35674x]|nr:hypothetical protein N7451_003095 [Penicillium sp. IBT 35674x]